MLLKHAAASSLLLALSSKHNWFAIKIAAMKLVESEFDPGYVESGENIF